MMNKKIGLIGLILAIIVGCQKSNEHINKESEQEGIIKDSYNNIYYVIQVESKYDFMQNFRIKNLMVDMKSYSVCGIESHQKQQYDFLFYVYDDVYDGKLAYEPHKNLCLFTEKKIESRVFVNFAAFHIESVKPISFQQFKNKLQNK